MKQIYELMTTVVLSLRILAHSRLRTVQHRSPLFSAASIEILGEECLSNCFSLSELTFEAGSRIRQLGRAPFAGSSLLKSIRVPAKVENIPDCCFAQCTGLVDISFEADSKLLRIEYRAFQSCISLRSIAIPSLLAIIIQGAFNGCIRLSLFRFDNPSQLKQLSLHGSQFGTLVIPDCVEVIHGSIGGDMGRIRHLKLSRESCLKEIELNEMDEMLVFWKGPDAFVDLPEELLLRFRCKFEA
jgi:hypothetical protein